MDDFEEQIGLDTIISMPQDISDAGNLLPWNFRVAVLERVREMPTCLGYNLEAAFKSQAADPIIIEINGLLPWISNSISVMASKIWCKRTE